MIFLDADEDLRKYTVPHNIRFQILQSIDDLPVCCFTVVNNHHSNSANYNSEMKWITSLLLAGCFAEFSSAFLTVQSQTTMYRPPSLLRMRMASSNSLDKVPQRLRFSFGKRKSTEVKTSSFPIHYIQPSVMSHLKQCLTNIGSKVKDIDEVAKWQVAATTFVASIFLFQSWYDKMLVNVWDFLQHGVSLFPLMFRHDHWEWMLAVTCFFVYIHGFYAMDKAVIDASRKGRVHPWKKFRLQDRYIAQKFVREQLRRQERGEIVDSRQQPPILTEQSQWNWQAWVFELPLYVLPLYVWDVMIPRRAGKIAMWGAPTALQVFREVGLGLLLYDIMFFCGHFLMHKIPIIYKYVHKKHHINPECRAAEIVRLSAVEEVLEVGMSIVALNFLGAHPITRSIYNCIITFLLTELHCGFDLPWTPQNVIPFGQIGRAHV